MSTAAAAAWAPALFAMPTAPVAPETASRHGSGDVQYRFFDAAEARFIEAACARLIPADASGPGALGAGVPLYLDRQLGGSWGAGERLYRGGPWQPGTTPLGAHPPLTPARAFRSALRSIIRGFDERGTSFAQLPAAAQDAFLAALERDEGAACGISPAVFFGMLLTMTAEGFFSHPLYGATRDRVRWRVRGFPGAFAVVAP